MLRRLVMWFLVVGTILIIPSAVFARQDSAGGSQGTTAPAQNEAPQQKPAQDPNQPKQSIPDAPSAVQPPSALPQLPTTPGSEEQRPEQQPAPAAQAPAANEPPPRETPIDEPAGPKPPLNVQTVPQGGATPADSEAQYPPLRINVNQVIVQVTVKHEFGHMV